MTISAGTIEITTEYCFQPILIVVFSTMTAVRAIIIRTNTAVCTTAGFLHIGTRTAIGTLTCIPVKALMETILTGDVRINSPADRAGIALQI